MADFSALAATAQRLIDANGREVSVVKRGSYAQDTDKPWRATDDYPETVVTGKAVFVSGSDLGHNVRDAENVRRADKVALFAADNDGGNHLEEFHVIVDGDAEWKITNAEVLQPADTRLLYLFEVER